MDLGTIIGFLSGGFFVIFSIFLSAKFDLGRVLSIIDAPSIMITFGGAAAATLIAYPIPQIINGLGQIKRTFKPPSINTTDTIAKIIDLANLARKEGLLALEETAQNMDDAFLKKGILLIVDGTDQELVRSILETEMSFIEERHGYVRGVWDFIGDMGPAYGMIGTLIGLIMMLQDMNDPSQLGGSMAVALVTTFYGSMLANYVCIPVSNKLKLFTDDEMLLKEILVEGMLSIQAGENPRIIEEKLKSFLSPRLRSKFVDGGVS